MGAAGEAVPSRVLDPRPPLGTLERASEAGKARRRRIKDAEDCCAHVRLELVSVQPGRRAEPDRGSGLEGGRRLLFQQGVDETICILGGDLAAVE